MRQSPKTTSYAVHTRRFRRVASIKDGLKEEATQKKKKNQAFSILLRELGLWCSPLIPNSILTSFWAAELSCSEKAQLPLTEGLRGSPWAKGSTGNLSFHPEHDSQSELPLSRRGHGDPGRALIYPGSPVNQKQQSQDSTQAGPTPRPGTQCGST